MLFGFGIEAVLLFILGIEVPHLRFIGYIAGWLQIPSIAPLIGVPLQITPNQKRAFFVYMFVVQGSFFSVLAFGIRALTRRWLRSEP
jgi:hypothetical protein